MVSTLDSWGNPEEQVRKRQAQGSIQELARHIGKKSSILDGLMESIVVDVFILFNKPRAMS